MSWVMNTGQYIAGRKRIKMRNVKDWEEEVSSNSTLKWSAKVQGWSGMVCAGSRIVCLLFRLRTGSAGLEDKK